MIKTQYLPKCPVCGQIYSGKNHQCANDEDAQKLRDLNKQADEIGREISQRIRHYYDEYLTLLLSEYRHIYDNECPVCGYEYTDKRHIERCGYLLNPQKGV